MAEPSTAVPPTSAVRAAVDCGTNSTRLLVVGPDDEVLAREVRITRLGEGVDEHHRLDDDAIARTLTVLGAYREQMAEGGVERARLVATSAVRDASNRRAFLDAASRVIGYEAEVLTGTEEGTLAYRGAVGGLPTGAGDDVVVDIGGGSTELVVGGDGTPEVVSLDIGCVRLTERHLHHDPPRREELWDAQTSVGVALERAERSLPSLAPVGGQRRLIGLAGTVATLSMLEQNMIEYDRDRVHASVLELSCVERWCDTLATESKAARSLRAGMLAGREDVIVAGALILREVMRRWRFDRCVVSESDILDGLVESLRDDARRLPGRGRPSG